MHASYLSLLGFVLLHFVITVSLAERLSISGIENRDRLTWKRIATVCMRRNLFITYRIVYNADRGCCPKLLMYSDEQYQKIVFIKSLEILDQGQNVLDEDVAKKLYSKGGGLMSQVQRRLESSHSCSQVNKKQMQVLDPSQIVSLCPKSGISIASQGQSFRSCTGSVKLTKKVALPNRTIAESWYGRKENNSITADDEQWTENTWHIALTNCPSNGPLRISYHVIIDSVNNYGKMEKDKSYEDPKLENWCPRIMLPPELRQYAPRGRAQHSSSHVGLMLVCTLFLHAIFLC